MIAKTQCVVFGCIIVYIAQVYETYPKEKDDVTDNGKEDRLNKANKEEDIIAEVHEYIEGHVYCALHRG